jgi:Tfp pilus assembly protein PilF
MTQTSSTDRLNALQRMVEKDGFDQLAHFLLGREYMNTQQWMKAAAEFRRTTELNPEYTAAWKYMGEAYQRAGVYKEAAAAYEHGIRISEQTGDLQAGREMKVLLEKATNSIESDFR